MTVRIIRHVDAFTATPLEGNPAAVVDGEGLAGDVMQRIALNQRLSETVFLLPPEDAANHARLRIFTPAVELPFAGHPVVAASHVLISEGTVTLGPQPGAAVLHGEALRLETGVGVIPVEVSGGEPPLYTMTQAAPKFRPSEHAPDAIAPWVGLSAGDIVRAEWVSTGIYWLIAQVASLDAMLRVRPDMTALLAVPQGLAIFCLGAVAGSGGARARVRPGGGRR